MTVRNPRPESQHTSVDTRLPPDPTASLIGRPLVLAASFFIVGILAQEWWIALSLAAVILVVHPFLRGRSSLGIIAAMIGFLALGWARQALSTGQEPGNISHFIDRGYMTVRGRVVSDPEPSTFSTAFLMRANEVETRNGLERRDGTVMVRIPNSAGTFEYGEGIEVRGALQRPGGSENPGLFKYPEYLARMGVYSAAIIRRQTDVRRIPRDTNFVDTLARGAQNTRESLIRALDSALPPLEANLLAGIVLGQRTRLPAELKDDFATTGATHILAASGMNVGIVAAAVFGLGRAFRFRKSGAAWLAILAMLAYTLLAGAKPSVVRADVMATAFLAAAVVNREPDLFSSLALSALILLLWNPVNLYDPGSQLSFVVVGALIGVMPLLQPYLQAALGTPGKHAPIHVRLVNFAVGAIIMSIVAQAAALPLIAQHFHQVSLLGILANALILPVIPALFCGGFVLWAVALASRLLSAIIAWPLGVLLAYVIGVARTFGSTPWSVLNVESPGWGMIAVYYAAFANIIWRLRLWQSRRGVESE